MFLFCDFTIINMCSVTRFHFFDSFNNFWSVNSNRSFGFTCIISPYLLFFIDGPYRFYFRINKTLATPKAKLRKAVAAITIINLLELIDC
jgi:hypothetical protein